MVFRTRRKRTDGAGFTLLELLLTVALLLALLAAVVYNFQSAQRGADLDEGTRQVEALIRFAAAQAANSGKMVQVRFGDDPTASAGKEREQQRHREQQFQQSETGPVSSLSTSPEHHACGLS